VSAATTTRSAAATITVVEGKRSVAISGVARLMQVAVAADVARQTVIAAMEGA